MKNALCCVVLLCLSVPIAFGQDTNTEDKRLGRPRSEWTSGNYFDVRLLNLDLSPFDLTPGVTLDYWSGYHHLSYPIGARGDLYAGVGWGFISLFAELGYGWNIPGSAPNRNWETHVTAFAGPVTGNAYSGGLVVGVRSAFKFLVTGRSGRTHFFAGTGLTVAFDQSYGRFVVSMPLQTGITVSSRRTR